MVSKLKCILKLCSDVNYDFCHPGQPDQAISSVGHIRDVPDCRDTNKVMDYLLARLITIYKHPMLIRGRDSGFCSRTGVQNNPRDVG